MRKPHAGQRLADERDVVGGAAAAARLRDDDGQLVRVVAAAHHSLHDLAGDQDGRVADVVVHVLQARVHRTVVHAGQKLQVVAEAMEDLHQQIEVDGRHLRAEDGVARLLHLLREHRARELRGGALALPDALAHLGCGFLGEGGGSAHRAARARRSVGCARTRARVRAPACRSPAASQLRGDATLRHARLGVDARVRVGHQGIHVKRCRRAAARHALGIGRFISLVFECRQQ